MYYVLVNSDGPRTISGDNKYGLEFGSIQFATSYLFNILCFTSLLKHDYHTCFHGLYMQRFDLIVNCNLNSQFTYHAMVCDILVLSLVAELMKLSL